MITTTNSTMAITMQEHNPKYRREQLLAALAAAMRWYAHTAERGGVYDTDWDNIHTIAQLQEELLYTETQCNG